jgi:pimeloyl-ACP methyl ester carboxylesterase
MNLINIQGVRLEVKHIAAPAGAPSRTPIVFLHEGLGSVAMWRDWPKQLCQAAGREGWVYSRRGYGQSDAVPDVRGAPARVHGQRSGRLLPDYMHHEAWEVLPALLAPSEWPSNTGATRPSSCSRAGRTARASWCM